MNFPYTTLAQNSNEKKPPRSRNSKTGVSTWKPVAATSHSRNQGGVAQSLGFGSYGWLHRTLGIPLA
jgi:hypothetical protein